MPDMEMSRRNISLGLFQAKVSRRNDAFDDLEAPVGTYELRSYGGAQWGIIRTFGKKVTSFK